MTDKPIIVPNAYNATDGTGGLLDEHFAGTKCKHGVYCPGPAYRLEDEDGTWSRYCTVCCSERGIEVSNV
jgi:hypothetical protein